MPSLFYYLRRTREQSVRETLHQARLLLSARTQRLIQPAYDRAFKSAPTVEHVLRRCGFKESGELWAAIRARSVPVLFEAPLSLDAAALDERIPDWHLDHRSGYSWNPRLHYRQIPLAPKPGVDIKVPWEASRFHEGVVLAQAYRQTADERYAAAFVKRVLDWIENNPYRFGVNWTSAMEAGIRAVNWTCAFYLLRQSKVLDADFVARFVTSLYAHAGFIRSNLEYREGWVDGKRRRLNSNHYLCDLAGLIFIAVLFPELKLEEVRQFASRELEVELLQQTHSDGVDYEHSTWYHRFVTEIFVTTFDLLEINGHALKPGAGERLEQMRSFLSSCMHPDGTLPQIGDNDSGRLHPIPVLTAAPDFGSREYPEAGFYSLRGNRSHVLVSTASVGMHGFGSHSHNDILSFEYWWNGQAWIVDPGTYAYLPDPQARNWFRSTEAHNTVRVDSEEINPFHDQAVFQMIDHAKVRVHLWDSRQAADVLEAEHTGYARLRNGVHHRRRFTFEKESAKLTLADTLDGSGSHLLEWFFQIHPDVDVKSEKDGFIVKSEDRRIRISFDSGLLSASLVPGWYSPAYGVRQRSTRIVAVTHAPLPLTTQIVIEPC